MQIWEIDSIKNFCIDVSGDVKHGLPLVGEGTVCTVPIKAPGLQIYNVFYHFCFKGTYFLRKFQCWTQQTYFRNTWLYLPISVTKIWRHANFSLVYQLSKNEAPARTFMWDLSEILTKTYNKTFLTSLSGVFSYNAEPCMDKRIDKSKGNKYSTFLYCRLHNTIVHFPENKLSLLSYF